VPKTENPTWLSAALREPLLHFLLIGVALFALYGAFGGSRAPAADQVIIDRADLERLSQQFQRTWLRPPTEAELRGLADDLVKEEILYREALALGLERDDLVIRRRMRQKMEFLNTDLVDQTAPTEADLAAYLAANPERFRLPQRIDFVQIYFDHSSTDAPPEARAAALLTRLRTEPGLGSDPQALGDPTLLPPSVKQATPRDIAGNFGTELAGSLAETATGGWSGPYPSAFGWHLVRVTAREPSRLPQLSEIRPQVERDWLADRRARANERFYEALKGRYQVRIDLPEAGSASPSPQAPPGSAPDAPK
jgi:hypothetical protein